jgi:hypothetical protein
MAEKINSKRSSAELPIESIFRRRPRRGWLKRDANFLQAFEDRVLLYDAFRDIDGKRILLIGPPPMSLMPEFNRAIFTALPSGKNLSTKFHVSRSTIIIETCEAPRDTNSIKINICNEEFVLPVQPNHSQILTGKNVLFSMNRNNKLAWIEEWARFHVETQKVQGIILFDNESDAYGVADIENILEGIPHLDHFLVMPTPFKFGPVDRGVIMYPYYPRFLQISHMSIVLHRFAAHANGLLNMDIDELFYTPGKENIFDLAKERNSGLLMMKGEWVESVANGETYDHRDYHYVLRDFRRLLCANKWALDPTRNWIKSLEHFPYFHRFKPSPNHVDDQNHGVSFFHFKGINTNWKSSRRKNLKPSPLLHRRDKELTEMLRQK